MKESKSFLIIIVFFLLFYSLLEGWLACETGWKICPPPPKGYSSRGEFKYVKIAGQDIKVDLALTKEVRAQGLSGRKGLKENEGMLFIFDRSGNYPFWMKDMFFPIDIIWIDKNMKVIYIKKDARPESYPEIYGPQKEDQNAKYILEVVSGFSDKNNLKVGDKVLFTY